MNYYSSVNSHLVSRKPTFFKKGLNVNTHYSPSDKKPIYRKESVVMKSIKLFTLLLLFVVIGMVAYLNFHLITVL